MVVDALGSNGAKVDEKVLPQFPHFHWMAKLLIPCRFPSVGRLAPLVKYEGETMQNEPDVVIHDSQVFLVADVSVHVTFSVS